MANLTTAESRRWAEDMRAYWADTRYADKAKSHAALMIARADLDDAEADRETITADKAIMEYNLPILGRYTVSGKMERTYDCCYDDAMADYCESRGMFTGWEWSNDPAAEEHCGELVRLYIGSRESGPEAQYNACDRTWYKLTSRGNFGKKYACGGNWRSEKCTGNDVPEIYTKLQEVIMDYKRIERAKVKVAAAEKRVFAAQQREMSAAYFRQAEHPIYAGQEIICANKGAVVEALAAKTEAEADLMEAQAGL